MREVNALGDGKLFVYDGVGNLIQKTDEEGNVIQYEYTATSRIRDITYGDGKTAQFAYNKAGQLVEMQDWNGITQIDRDPLQRVKSVVDALGHEVRYDWDEVSNRTKITYPDGGAYRYGYDAERRNISMTGPDGLATAFRFDAAVVTESVIPTISGQNALAIPTITYCLPKINCQTACIKKAIRYIINNYCPMKKTILFEPTNLGTILFIPFTKKLGKIRDRLTGIVAKNRSLCISVAYTSTKKTRLNAVSKSNVLP